MKRIFTLFGVTLLFNLLLLVINAWGEQYIAFHSNRTGNFDIYIIDRNGENLRNLTNHPASDVAPTWAPDGHSLAFQSTRDGNPEIYIMDINSNQVRRLTNHPRWDLTPTWSPDGNWIAFVSDRNGTSHVYKIDINGKNLRQLTIAGKYNLQPAWHPDGQSIFFARPTVGFEGQIFKMDTNGFDTRGFISFPQAEPGSPAWAPDGKQIAYTSNIGGRSIYIADAKGKNPRLVSPVDNYWSNAPTWSPDAKWIAYYATIEFPADNPNATEDIYICSVNGGKPQRITQHLGDDGYPAWAPEGFFSVNPTANTQAILWGQLKQTDF